MSAYVVEDETLAKIVGFLSAKVRADRYYYPARMLAEKGFDLSNDAGCLRLAQAMHELNVRAVNARYSESDTPRQIRILPLIPVFIVAYKALGCWRYQCCEGDIPETSDLYHTMTEVMHEMAVEKVNHLPEYERAPWG